MKGGVHEIQKTNPHCPGTGFLPGFVLLHAGLAAELTEAQVEEAVAEQGKEAVTGNVFIWFLCAIAFLKVSQKIDSFMASWGLM